MTQPSMPTKAELIEALRSTGAESMAKLRALPPDTFEAGRYENGWNGRQILAHVASIEWTYPRLIAMARGDLPRPEPARTDPRSTEEPYRPSMAGGINDYNARQVEKRANATVAELLAEFETNRATTIAAVESADEALLRTPIRSAGGVTGPLSAVINAIAVLHVVGHVNDIVGGPPR